VARPAERLEVPVFQRSSSLAYRNYVVNDLGRLSTGDAKRMFRQKFATLVLPRRRRVEMKLGRAFVVLLFQVAVDFTVPG
jgi:hypothetical protein